MLAPRKKVLTALVAGGVLVTSSGLAYADDISNNLDSSIDAAAEIMALNVGGGTKTTSLYVSPTNGDGKQGCNLTSSKTLTLSIGSNNTAVATVSPSSVTFTSCSATELLTVTPVAQGSATISATQTRNTTEGTFSLASVTFTANVAAPANTAPTVSVGGVAAGGSYSKGSVPAATCSVVDAEDGNSSPAATLSAVTGLNSADGIGTQEASCSYTDRGGLQAVSSVSYSIVDPTAPVISKVLSPVTPDGANGWYKGNVALDWTVTENESPNSLVKTGCADQNVTADQAATDYTCSATSAGGAAAEQSVTIQRDGTAPSISGADVDDTTWRNTSLAAQFTASDATSGIPEADKSFTLTASAESASATTPTTVSKAVTDAAGNSTTRTLSARIDTTAPEVVAPAANQTWSKAASVQSGDYTASDALSGIADADKTFKLTATAESTSAAGTVVTRDITDRAGNTTVASFTALIDRTDPTVSFTGGPAADSNHYTTKVPAAPTCNGSDALSGLAATNGCVISGYSTQAGTHTMTATATDKAGNTASISRTYTVRDLTSTGFYNPVDMGGIINTVKAGSTVPLKFNIQIDGVQQTATSLVTSFTANQTNCTLAGVDDIEIVTTGATALRYDSTAGQFIQNWKTPTAAGTCYKATATLADGEVISALFKLK